jgi:hypothetical protein
MTLLAAPGPTLTVPLPGLEPDNLLAFMALLGLRTLEAVQPNWKPRASWKGPPWTAQLHLATFTEPIQIAHAANEGIGSCLNILTSISARMSTFQLRTIVPTPSACGVKVLVPLSPPH